MSPNKESVRGAGCTGDGDGDDRGGGMRNIMITGTCT